MKRPRQEWVSGHEGVVRRIILPRNRELSCLPSELGDLAQWIADGGHGRMPVAEYTQHPWKENYRWTAAAWRAAVDRRRAR